MNRSGSTIKKHLLALYEFYGVEDGFGLMSLFVESSVLTRIHAKAAALHKEQNHGAEPRLDLHLEVRANRPWVRVDATGVVGSAAIEPAHPSSHAPTERGWRSCRSNI